MVYLEWSVSLLCSFFVCYGVALISRLCALDNGLVRSRLTVSCCSDGFRGLAARTLCPLLDAQHAFAHHDDVREFHKQVEEDHWREPVVVRAHTRDQARLVFFEW